jgi:hypothetical protein
MGPRRTNKAVRVTCTARYVPDFQRSPRISSHTASIRGGISLEGSWKTSQALLAPACLPQPSAVREAVQCHDRHHDSGPIHGGH